MAQARAVVGQRRSVTGPASAADEIGTWGSGRASPDLVWASLRNSTQPSLFSRCAPARTPTSFALLRRKQCGQRCM